MGTFMTVTRSSGSGMRDLPCAGDGNRPRFSCPRIFSSRPGFSCPRSSRPVPSRVSAPTLTHVRDRPGKTQQTGIFCGKSFIAYIFRSKRVRARAREQERARKQEKEQEQESKRENGKTPSLLRRIILRLGRITP